MGWPKSGDNRMENKGDPESGDYRSLPPCLVLTSSTLAISAHVYAWAFQRKMVYIREFGGRRWIWSDHRRCWVRTPDPEIDGVLVSIPWPSFLGFYWI